MEIDMLWAERRVVVEADGRAAHDTEAAFHGDRRRDQLLVAAGYRTAHVTWRQLHDELPDTVDRITRIFRS